MNNAFPNLARALIVNTGRIWEDITLAKMSNNISETKARYKALPFVGMIASPTDFRYEFMKRDKGLIDYLGWPNYWVEFEGGHKMAPPEIYDQVFTWLFSQSGWQNK